MDIDRLRYFKVIANAGSMTTAAEILHISPAALSKAMSVLEAEIGVKLFQRAGRGISLTSEGRTLLPRTEAALELIASLKPSESSVSPKERVLRIGSFEVFSTHFLGTLLRDDLGAWGLELHELLPGNLEKAVLEERVDFGITYVPIPAAGLDFLKVSAITMGVYGRPSFRRIKRFEELPFAVPVLPIHGAPTKVSGLDGWPDSRLPRYQKYKVTLMESALELCRQEKCVAYLPSFIVHLHNKRVVESFRLVEIPIPRFSGMKQAVFLVKRKTMDEDAIIKKVASAVRVASTLI
jgi:DNA-binding transcriptional LysR family regulator